MAKSELYDKGMAVCQQLLGEAFVARLHQNLYDDPAMQKFREVTTETVFGALWTRPGLDFKIRALVCVVSNTALGREPELALRPLGRLLLSANHSVPVHHCQY